MEEDDADAEMQGSMRADSDGGGVRWATICSLIATAKLNNVEPFAWLRDILQRMTDGHPASRLDELPVSRSSGFLDIAASTSWVFVWNRKTPR
jgi:hypothetical protein